MNFWMVVKTTPPAARVRSWRSSARLSACSGVWRSRSLHRAKTPKSCPSRSRRSVRTTIVGFAIAGSAISFPAKNAIVRLLPEPCVCQITPPRPVAVLARRIERRLDGLASGVELVVAGDLLRRASRPRPRRRRSAEAGRGSGALEHPRIRTSSSFAVGRRHVAALQRPPAHEPLPRRR